MKEENLVPVAMQQISTIDTSLIMHHVEENSYSYAILEYPHANPMQYYSYYCYDNYCRYPTFDNFTYTKWVSYWFVPTIVVTSEMLSTKGAKQGTQHDIQHGQVNKIPIKDEGVQ